MTEHTARRGPARPRPSAGRRGALQCPRRGGCAPVRGRSRRGHLRQGRRTSGSSKMTLYKWWPSPGALALEAYFTAVEATLAFADTGDIERDLSAQLHAFVRLLTEERGGPVIAELVGAAQVDPDLAAAFSTHYTRPRRKLAVDASGAPRSRARCAWTSTRKSLVDQLWGPLSPPAAAGPAARRRVRRRADRQPLAGDCGLNDPERRHERRPPAGGRASGQVVVRAADPGHVPVGRAPDGRAGIRIDHPAEVAVQAVERPIGHRRRDPVDDRGRQRDRVRVAAHEGRPLAVRGGKDGVARQHDPRPPAPASQ